MFNFLRLHWQTICQIGENFRFPRATASCGITRFLLTFFIVPEKKFKIFKKNISGSFSRKSKQVDFVDKRFEKAKQNILHFLSSKSFFVNDLKFYAATIFWNQVKHLQPLHNTIGDAVKAAKVEDVLHKEIMKNEIFGTFWGNFKYKNNVSENFRMNFWEKFPGKSSEYFLRKLNQTFRKLTKVSKFKKLESFSKKIWKVLKGAQKTLTKIFLWKTF